MRFLKELFSGKKKVAGPTHAHLSVDGAHLPERSERQSPREQLQVLQYLARFARQEGFGITCLLEGRGLREVTQGAFNGIAVEFVETAAALNEKLVALARKRAKSSTVVVVADARMEKLIEGIGCSTLRCAW